MKWNYIILTSVCLTQKVGGKKKKKKNGRFSSVQTPKPHELSQLTLPSEKQTVVNVIDLTN